MEVKHLAFDLDGVIVEALDIHRESFVQAWNEVVGHIWPLTKAFHNENIASLSTRQKVATLRLLARITDAEALEVERRKQELTSFHIDFAPPTVPWLAGLIASFRADGRKIALVSNSIRMTCERVLANLGLTDLFDVIVSSSDVAMNKPDPQPYETAAALLGLETSQVVALEDSVPGLRSAKAAGCWVYVVTIPNHDLLEGKLREWLKNVDDA